MMPVQWLCPPLDPAPRVPAGGGWAEEGRLLPPSSSPFAPSHCLGPRVPGCLPHGHSLVAQGARHGGERPSCVLGVCRGRGWGRGFLLIFHLYFRKGNKMYRRPGQGAARMTRQLRPRVLPRLSVGKRADRGSWQVLWAQTDPQSTAAKVGAGGAPSPIGGGGALQK